MPRAPSYQNDGSTTTMTGETTSSSSIQYNSFGSTTHTVSTNSTLNSQNQSIQQPSNNASDGNIPSGYSVHIKASNNNNNDNQPFNVMSSTTTQSSAISPTTMVRNSSFNPSSIPALASSTDSLSAFDLFDGFNNFPIIGTNANVSFSSTNVSSSLSSTLFNTNPATNNVSTDMLQNNIVTDETVAQIVSNTSVPEFLYQLTKMLTDDHRDIIEWSNGKIEVHNPTKLEKEVLNQYFRHSKYASFQRQLNYFGFRKLAGKGKMAPCSYVNENATSDLRSLLRMKRKTSATTKEGKLVTDATNNSNHKVSMQNSNSKGSNGRQTTKKSNKRARINRLHQLSNHPGAPSAQLSPKLKIAKGAGIKHQLNNFLSNTSTTGSNAMSQSNPIKNPLEPDTMTSLDPFSLAKSAVGKGVTHQYQPVSNQGSSSNSNYAPGITNNIIQGMPTDSSNKLTFLDPSQLGMGIESCLSELQTNFRNSLNEGNQNPSKSNQQMFVSSNNQSQYRSTMTRDSSLVDLAIIPSLSNLPEASPAIVHTAFNNEKSLESEYGMTFIDFPTGGIDPSSLPPPP